MDGAHGARADARPALEPVRPRDVVTFLAMVLGMFMAILDIQIVASSLSEIQAGLAASPDEISWVQTSYLIAEVVMIPLSGMLARILSTRVLFSLSAASFTLASAACAFAWDLPSMILFRALQGFLGGAMVPLVFSASFILFPLERRPLVTVIIGLVATLAPTLGPTLGGWLTETLDWRWLFLVNVLPGIATATLGWALIRIDRPNLALLRGFDVPGLVFMALFLGSLQYVVEEGARNDWFEDGSIRAFAAVSAAGALLFFWRVLAYRQPIVDLRAFLNRNFAVGCLYSFVLGVGLYGSIFLLPMFLARVRGLNALQIGVIMMVTGVAQFLSAPLAAALSRRLEMRAMLALGLVLFGLGVWLNSFLTNQSGFWELFLPQAVRGVSLMLCFMPINTLALGTLPQETLKNASGLYNLMRNLGGAIGLAFFNTLLIERFALHAERLSEHVTLSRPDVAAYVDALAGRLGALMPGDAQLAATKIVMRLVEREATVLTFNDCLQVMALVFVGALLLMPILRRPPRPGSRPG
ncbi:MAG TPA: DHA2 family efflux MFS transporter permease subunit [Stellaceae bacterium]|nr:DHA2 family efflux MFS transporter permease subunit [Stellaceae bacterium]